MIALKNIALLARTIRIQPKQIASFSDAWKDRDDAAQKVYITRAEKQTMKKLLKKIQIQEQDLETNMEQFERRLRQVMRRYKIQNESLATQIANLHKTLTH